MKAITATQDLATRKRRSTRTAIVPTVPEFQVDGAPLSDQAVRAIARLLLTLAENPEREEP